VLPFEMEIHVYMVCDLDKRYATVHAVILAIKDHLQLKRSPKELPLESQRT
jgi:hypothetical protein